MQSASVSQIRTRLHATLCDASSIDGGWPYYPERTSRLEPTAWAMLALSMFPSGSAARIARARGYLRALGRASGLLVEAGVPGPNYGWNGLALLADVSGEGSDDAWRQSLASGLLAAKGIAIEGGTSPVRQNNSLQAWSWTEGTFSWVEPTALCMLALKRARLTGPLVRTRLAEAEAMIFDRVCENGGWNYGNAQVLGQDLRPYVSTTALAVLALQDRRDHPAVVKSIDWLRAHASQERSTMALSLATLCLDALGESSERSRALLERQISTTESMGNYHLLALALCALSSTQGRTALRLPQ